MPWGAAAIKGLAGLGGSLLQGNASKKAAKQQAQAMQAAAGMQQQAQAQAREDYAPWAAAGLGALGQMQQLNSGDYSGFDQSPDYLYARQQAQQGVERGAAARGNLYAGGTNVDLANALSGIASQNLGAYRGSLQYLTGLGQGVTGQLANLGQNAAQSAGNYMTGKGQAQAQGAMNQGNIYGNLANQLGQIGGNLYGQYQSGQAPAMTYTGNGTGTGSMSNFGSESGSWMSGIAGSGGGHY